MKSTLSIFGSLAALFLSASCSKIKLNPEGTASITLINAVVGTDTLFTNFSNSAALNGYYINANVIQYNVYRNYPYLVNNYQINSYAGKQQLMIYKMPDTLPKSSPLISVSLDLPIGSISTLFLTGTADAPDTLLTRDHIRNHLVTDSVTGIRFVNLSPGSNPISVNIQGHAPGTVVNNLSYKGVTDFMEYTATSDISSYTFEFRDAATGALLTSYLADGINYIGNDPFDRFNNWRFRNVTLALLGLPGGTGIAAQTILRIGHY